MTTNPGHVDVVPPAVAPITVAVALGPGSVRRTVLDGLETEADIAVVADISSGDSLFGAIRETVPDVALLSMQLSSCEPIAVCNHLADVLPVCRTALVFHSIVVPPTAIVAGAAGAVSATELERAPGEIVRRLARGEAFVPESWAGWMLDEYEALAEEAGPRQSRAPTLTATEREVLQRLAKGNTPAAIAAMHEVPTRQVQLHAGYAMVKLRQADERRRARLGAT
jgi:two-component system response regulator DesR